jgi:hypothetical protein
MPRLHRYREQTAMNVYDCLFDGFDDDNSGMNAGFGRLFGNRNIGATSLTNTIVAGQFNGDVIANWYARTNIQPSPELDAWANASTAEIIIGERPFWQLNLADLLRRTEKDPKIPLTIKEQEDDDRRLEGHAEELWAAFRGVWVPDVPGTDLVPVLSGADLERWKEVAQHVESKDRKWTRPLIVHVRQNFCVKVDTSPEAFAALKRSVPPGSIEPRPRVWIHLEGLMTRYIA